MVKLTILYGHPADPAEFERYYAQEHLPFAQKLGGVERFELHRVQRTLDGSPSPYYRIAEMWYRDAATLRETWESEDVRAVLADLDHFATGGATLLVAEEAMPA